MMKYLYNLYESNDMFKKIVNGFPIAGVVVFGVLMVLTVGLVILK